MTFSMSDDEIRVSYNTAKDQKAQVKVLAELNVTTPAAMAAKLRDWKDKDGNNRRSAEVVAEHVYFGDSKRSESDTASAPLASGDFREIPEDEEGELPF